MRVSGVLAVNSALNDGSLRSQSHTLMLHFKSVSACCTSCAAVASTFRRRAWNGRVDTVFSAAQNRRPLVRVLYRSGNGSRTDVIRAVLPC